MEQRMYETRVNNIDDVNLRLVDVCVWSASLPLLSTSGDDVSGHVLGE